MTTATPVAAKTEGTKAERFMSVLFRTS